jgi:hypothetical protein
MTQVLLDIDLKHDLMRKKENLMQQVAIEEHRYFHFGTIDNLLYHFDEVKTIADKRWVYSCLDNYFSDITTYINSIDRETSRSLHQQYLDKVTDYYNSNLGFIIMINRELFAGFYFVLFLIGYFAFNFWVSLIPVIIFAIRSFMIYKKWKDKRVYSLYY